MPRPPLSSMWLGGGAFNMPTQFRDQAHRDECVGAISRRIAELEAAGDSDELTSRRNQLRKAETIPAKKATSDVKS